VTNKGVIVDIEIIEKNWNTYKTILNRLEDENINHFLEELGDRICIAPSNSNNKQYGCYPGGLVSSSIKIAKSMQALNTFHETPCNIKSIYKIGLLHDIGRLGTPSTDWLLPQDSDWHREKLGNEFKINFDLPKLSHIHRTLMIINAYQIKITEDEFMALCSLEERDSKNTLGSILLHARDMLEN
tara:strand:- start:448 stop:1002 length:555 start_codon:yes stop_codon:yes gene_type:complete